MNQKKSPAEAGDFKFHWMSRIQYSELVRSLLDAE